MVEQSIPALKVVLALITIYLHIFLNRKLSEVVLTSDIH